MPLPATSHQSLAANVSLALAIKRLGQLLDLSAVQETQLGVMKAETGPRVRALGEHLIVARKQLNEQIDSEIFDEASIRRSAEGVAAAEADLAVERASISSSVRAILTYEQRQQLTRLRELPN